MQMPSPHCTRLSAILAVAAVWLAPAATAWACSCAHPRPLPQVIAASEQILVIRAGRSETIWDTDSPRLPLRSGTRRMHFAAIEVLKGDAARVPFLENSTFERSSCDFSLAFGMRYVVFLPPGSREIGSCCYKIHLGAFGQRPELDELRAALRRR